MLPKAVRELTQELTRLPGIGPKTAQRLSIWLLRQSPGVIKKFADTLKDLHANVRVCVRCFNLGEDELCSICKDQMRTAKLLCVVEDPLDIEALERTNSYMGRYHVLGGVLSPLQGVTADQLTLTQLFTRITEEHIEELIIALDHNLESEATTRHIVQQVSHQNLTISRLARGLPTGGDIEFADSQTLTAALSGRKALR